ncbi:MULTISPECIES: MBL fold metallo-hydrolase [Eubacterium]|uniref:MBL fold metallo-hydrolase n=1 Tax=Eubacterium callanderi TaxID=53442 RepID=A0A853JNU9_9FIRM|nr:MULTISPECIES: MBL fold metallo-hydrolase [Eubacterium]MBS4858556.1 MBL fold metallo-hydrolase [Eubacterium limosum]MBV1684035.1 MBL fold metallo-hydrolase [Eubacterium callanderi]MCC3403651.1 MBL fold metallo-hydrolase [Eubacterium callanderi]MCG4589941.1 MBL fold metallo-hydrolase [Eubacterium callanderi]MCQ4821694.1 MBL fold metallo-hydrolase [Eubacterium callanderi]
MKTEKLIVLGTGNAMVTECYNTCFAIKNGKEYFMVDAGGGNGILRQLKKASVNPAHIHHLFITHGHTDHVLGVVWLIRQIASMMLDQKYKGTFKIYCHDALIKTVVTICDLTLQKKLTALFGSRILLVPVQDGQTEKILDYYVTFFDIHSTKLKQFGFTTMLRNGQKLTCLGDEPFNPLCKKYVLDTDWLLSEAFCLYSERDIFDPYEKHHSTVREACELAEEMKIANLVLWHTEEKNLQNRKKRYKAEGKQYFKGKIYVPEDLDIIKLK